MLGARLQTAPAPLIVAHASLRTQTDHGSRHHSTQGARLPVRHISDPRVPTAVASGFVPTALPRTGRERRQRLAGAQSFLPLRRERSGSGVRMRARPNITNNKPVLPRTPVEKRRAPQSLLTAQAKSRAGDASAACAPARHPPGLVRRTASRSPGSETGRIVRRESLRAAPNGARVRQRALVAGDFRLGCAATSGRFPDVSGHRCWRSVRDPLCQPSPASGEGTVRSPPVASSPPK